jgi:hypothetical protein
VLCISIVHLVFIIMDEVDNQTGVDIFTHLLKYGGWYSGLMVPYCLLALGLVGFLGTFHCTLVSAGQTTNEKAPLPPTRTPLPAPRILTLNPPSLLHASS